MKLNDQEEALVLERLLYSHTDIYYDLWRSLEQFLMSGKELILHTSEPEEIILKNPTHVSGLDFFSLYALGLTYRTLQGDLNVTTVSEDVIYASKQYPNSIYGLFPQILLLNQETYLLTPLTNNSLSLKLHTPNISFRERVHNYLFKMSPNLQSLQSGINHYLKTIKLGQDAQSLQKTLEDLKIKFPDPLKNDYEALKAWFDKQEEIKLGLTDISEYYEAHMKIMYRHSHLTKSYKLSAPKVTALITDLKGS